MLKQEINIFFTALMYYTRIPCPAWITHKDEYLNEATRYFPLMGWIVGGISALMFYVCQLIFPLSISLVLSMVQSILLTGAFHEDGFADVCDGFGGGWTKSKILEIMKDSRVGTYGLVGLGCLLGLKFLILWELAQINISYILFGLIAGHSLSRFITTTFIYTHEYAREDALSKAKPIAKRISLRNLFIAGFFGLLPLTLFLNPWIILLIIPMYLLKIYLGWYFKKWIGGYTGDCLGATQQLTEVTFYLGLFLIIKYLF